MTPKSTLAPAYIEEQHTVTVRWLRGTTRPRHPAVHIILLCDTSTGTAGCLTATPLRSFVLTNTMPVRNHKHRDGPGTARGPSGAPTGADLQQHIAARGGNGATRPGLQCHTADTEVRAVLLNAHGREVLAKSCHDAGRASGLPCSSLAAHQCP